MVEYGLREVLAVRLPRRRYRLPDSSVGNADAADPLEARSWPDLRGMIHGEYGEREHGDRVDTNLPVHVHRRESCMHEPAYALVRALAEGKEAWVMPWPCCYEFLGSRDEPPIQLSLIQPKGDAP